MSDPARHQLSLFDPSAFELARAWVDGRCRACARSQTELGHDPCIANLPGVRHACSGHGCEPPYLMTEAGVVTYGADAVL